MVGRYSDLSPDHQLEFPAPSSERNGWGYHAVEGLPARLQEVAAASWNAGTESENADICIRLRRAILRNNLPIARLIIRNNPRSIQNPDFFDHSNTSLHLACKHGSLELAKFLVDAGHEDGGISRNTDWETPLSLAIQAHQFEIAHYLIERFPASVHCRNHKGVNLLMATVQADALELLPRLFELDRPIPITETDEDGNTVLHHAAINGNLKIIQFLLQKGASTSVRNKANWAPIQYSATMMVELYFTKMAATIEKQQSDDRKRMKEQEDRRRLHRAFSSDDRIGLDHPLNPNMNKSTASIGITSFSSSKPDLDPRPSTSGGIRLVTPDEVIPFPPLAPETKPRAESDMPEREAELWRTLSPKARASWKSRITTRNGKIESDEEPDEDPESPEGPDQMFFP